MTRAQLILVVALSLMTGVGGGYTLALYLADARPPQIKYAVVYRYPTHALMATESWTEKDFQVLLRWERDGIFPRLGYDRDPPGWYEVEKTRRGIVVKPERVVTPEEFASPEFRRRRNP